MEVPSYEEFTASLKRIEELERMVKFLLVSQPNWLDLNQTAQALKVSKMTIWRLTKRGKLHPRYEGSKPLYEVEEIRAYIQSTRVSAEAADTRLLSAIRINDTRK